MTNVKEIRSRSEVVSPPTQDVSELIKVHLGVLWILQAIATTYVQKGELSEADLHDGEKIKRVLLANLSRLEEVMPELLAAIQLLSEHFGYSIHSSNGEKDSVEIKNVLPAASYEYTVTILLLTAFEDVLTQVLEAKDKMSEADVVMIVGHQGVGKSRAVEFFNQQGYASLSMSQIVREVVASWGLRDTGTIDKIVGGQVLKEYFGKDILVHLGIQYLVSLGKKKIVIDGPKVIEEAEAVVGMGGRLVGVVADIDPETDRVVRRARVKYRSEVDLSRQSDLPKFDNREMIEGPRINEILALVRPEDIFVNSEGGNLAEDLERAFPTESSS